MCGCGVCMWVWCLCGKSRRPRCFVYFGNVPSIVPVANKRFEATATMTLHVTYCVYGFFTAVLFVPIVTLASLHVH